MLVLDTCALLHLALGRTFGHRARDLLEAAVQRRQALVPAIAAVEIAQKVWTGGLRLPVAPAAWFAQALDAFRLRELPLRAAAAFGAYDLPEPFHRDPADRFMVAAARRLNAPLLTSDRRILGLRPRRARAGDRLLSGRPTPPRPQLRCPCTAPAGHRGPRSCRNAADPRRFTRGVPRGPSSR